MHFDATNLWYLYNKTMVFSICRTAICIYLYTTFYVFIFLLVNTELILTFSKFIKKKKKTLAFDNNVFYVIIPGLIVLAIGLRNFQAPLDSA